MFHKTIINQLLMIRKLPFMLIALCFLLSCGGDDPLDIKPEAPENPEKPEILFSQRVILWKVIFLMMKRIVFLK